MKSKPDILQTDKNVSEALFLKIFDGMSKGFAYCELIVDVMERAVNYRFLAVNSAFEKQLERDIDSTVGKTIKEISPDTNRLAIDRLGALVLGGKPIQYTNYDAVTKKYFYVKAFSQEENRFIMVIKDITAERDGIEELKFRNDEKEKRAAELVLANKELAFQNDEKEKRAAELVLANKELAFQNDEKEKRAIELVVANKELAFQNDEKEKRAIELGIVNKELEFQNNEKEKRALELVNAKEKAEESDWLKSAFLANMSHKIRSPMSGILGFSELLKSPNLSEEEQQDYIRIIEKSGHRMLNTINDIISISKIESGLMEVDINELSVNEQIEDIYTFFKPEVLGKGLQFTAQTSLTDDQSIINTDREKVFTILTNLVKNAIKFTEFGFIEIGYIKKGDFLEFYVKDSGAGIHSYKQIAIFERFIYGDITDSRAYEGTGLGLSIAKAFVEILGGEIRVESEKEKGSSFYFTVPYVTKSLKSIDTKNGAKDYTQDKKLKVLIVEDDEISFLLLNVRLMNVSREILHAKNGLEAIDYCRNNSDIDLILMDIKMPLMDGHKAIQEIRKFNKDIIIIAQTANAYEVDRDRVIASGCNEYILKPIVFKELISLIHQYFIN